VSDIEISFIIPTRERPEKLKRCLSCIYQKAVIPERVEVLLKIDDDDITTIDLLKSDEEIRDYPNIRLFNGPRIGWGNTNKMICELLNYVKGDIIVPFADDRDVTMDKWDETFVSFADQSVVFGFRIMWAFTRKAMNEFGFLRNWVRGSADNYIWRMSKRLEIYKRIPKWFIKRESADNTKRTRALVFDYVPSAEIKDWKNNL
jgi:hypothetical protein